MYSVRRRKFLRWGCYCPSRVHVLCWVCLDVHVLFRMRHDFCDLCADRLRRGVRVRGRVGSASRVHLQRRLHIHIDDDNLMCG